MLKQQIRLTFIAIVTVVFLLPDRALAQVAASPVYRMASGPTLAGSVEHLLLCAGNLGSTPVTVKLEILQAVTGAIVAGPEQITLPPLNGNPVAVPGDPCLEFPGSVVSAPSAITAAATAATTTSVRPLYIGVVTVNSQSLPLSTACFNGNRFIGDLVASLQVFTPLAPAPGAATAVPTAIRYIPLLPSDPCLPIGSILSAGT